MSLIEKMKAKVLDIINPEIEYTQEDFNKEFSSVSTTSNSNYKLDVRFLNTSSNPNPEYATAGSSGFDLRASLDEPVTILSGERNIVPTGLYFEIPDNFEIQVRSRSGWASKTGVVVLNSPGTIDSDYTGEIKVILINHSKNNIIINNGDRIAQGIIASVITKNTVNLREVSNVVKVTIRGNNGFGSTGIS